MILKIESNSGLWNPQQLKELSNLMENSSYVIKFLSDKTVALVVDDSDEEPYTKELTKMGFKVSKDVESVDSLISGTNETKNQEPLTDSEGEDMNMNIKEDNSKVQENIPDIHINTNEKLDAKEEVMIENNKESSENIDIKISDTDDEDKKEDKKDDKKDDAREIIEDKNLNENTEEPMKETEPSNDKVEEVKEEMKEEVKEDTVLEDEDEQVIEDVKEEPVAETKEEPVEEVKEEPVAETKEEEKIEEEAVLESFDEVEPEVEEKMEEVKDEVKDDTSSNTEEQYTEEKEARLKEDKEEVMNIEEIENKTEDLEHKEEDNYKDSEDDLISDVENFMLDEEEGSSDKVLDINNLVAKDEEIKSFYNEPKGIDTIGIETYAGNLNLSFGSGISITLALADCKDEIKTFNINGKSIYIEYMDNYCLISYDNMQIRVPSNGIKKVG